MACDSSSHSWRQNRHQWPPRQQKKVFNRVFVQNPTYSGPSNSVVIRQHAPKSGWDYPSQPARRSLTSEGGTVHGTSCPKSPEIHHPDNPDMRTLTGIILVKSRNSGPAPLREHAGYHRPRRSTVNPGLPRRSAAKTGLPRRSAAKTGLPRRSAAKTGLPRRSAAKTGDITMACPLQKIHLRTRRYTHPP